MEEKSGRNRWLPGAKAGSPHPFLRSGLTWNFPDVITSAQIVLHINNRFEVGRPGGHMFTCNMHVYASHHFIGRPKMRRSSNESCGQSEKEFILLMRVIYLSDIHSCKVLTECPCDTEGHIFRILDGCVRRKLLRAIVIIQPIKWRRKLELTVRGGKAGQMEVSHQLFSKDFQISWKISTISFSQRISKFPGKLAQLFVLLQVQGSRD